MSNPPVSNGVPGGGLVRGRVAEGVTAGGQDPGVRAVVLARGGKAAGFNAVLCDTSGEDAGRRGLHRAPWMVSRGCFAAFKVDLSTSAPSR